MIEQIEPQSGDKRNRPLQLTDKGREILATLAAKSDERMIMFFKDFKESDRIRDELVAMGVVLKDSKEGTTWEIAR